MLQIDFTDEQIEQLNYERYHYPVIQRRMETLYLKSQKLPHKEICRLCRISRPTLAKDLRSYQEGGIEALKVLRYKGQPSQLNAHSETLTTYFQEHPPRTTAETQAVIEELTGIKRSPTQIKRFRKRIGCHRLKVRHVPGKSNEPGKIEEQESFRQQQLEPLLEEAKRGERAVFSWMQLISSIVPTRLCVVLLPYVYPIDLRTKALQCPWCGQCAHPGSVHRH